MLDWINPGNWELAEKITEITGPLKTIANFLDYIFNPSKIFIGLWNWTLIMSYWICLFIALFALISYVLGVKKFAKFLPFSVGMYALIQAIGSVI